MREIITSNYQKIADLKTFPGVPHIPSICKEKSDDPSKYKKTKRFKKKKKLPQLGIIVDDITINDIRE